MKNNETKKGRAYYSPLLTEKNENDIVPVHCDSCGCDMGQMSMRDAWSFYQSHCGDCISELKDFADPR
jgi:hypothetical protein